MSRRLYGLSGLKLLLQIFCSWDLCGLRCLPWRAKRTRRAQQCSAIWRTTMPLSGPCLNGMLGSQQNRCRPIIRLFFRVFLYWGRNSTMASEQPDCRSEQRGCPRRRGDRKSGSLHVSCGRVEDGRGSLGALGHRPVSHPRSSNRTCRFPASGFPTGFTAMHATGPLWASVEGTERQVLDE